jgi:hypothetical protein
VLLLLAEGSPCSLLCWVTRAAGGRQGPAGAGGGGARSSVRLCLASPGVYEEQSREREAGEWSLVESLR